MKSTELALIKAMLLHQQTIHQVMANLLFASAGTRMSQ